MRVDREVWKQAGEHAKKARVESVPCRWGGACTSRETLTTAAVSERNTEAVCAPRKAAPVRECTAHVLARVGSVRKEGANGVWVQALPDLACCPPGRSRLQDHLPTIARARPKSQLHSTSGTAECPHRGPPPTAQPALTSSQRLRSSLQDAREQQVSRRRATSARACGRGAPCVRASSAPHPTALRGCLRRECHAGRAICSRLRCERGAEVHRCSPNLT